jgi:hypothetical protein
MPVPTEVFLSHSSEDAPMPEKLSATLTRHGIPVFFSPVNITGAQQWQNEILGALRRCDWFVVLLSPKAINSMWVRREVAYALQDRRYEDRIIPVRYIDCPLESLHWLTLFQMIDLTADFKKGCRELLRIWGIGFREDLLP